MSVMFWLRAGDNKMATNYVYYCKDTNIILKYGILKLKTMFYIQCFGSKYQ
jgi:hypothetical protein